MNEFKIDVEDNCLVLLSGGIGAATLLACLKKQNVEQVNALFFYYGDYVSNEKQCAEKLANYYGINLRVMDISNIYGNNISVRYPVSFKQVNDFYIPYRNGVFVSVATAVAYYLHCSNIVWGTSSSSFNYYSDCQQNFVKTQKSAVHFGTNGNVNLLVPFSGLSKLDIRRMGKELGIPLELTWSCANSNGNPCGTCFGCIERNINFEILKTEDLQITKVCTQ